MLLLLLAIDLLFLAVGILFVLRPRRVNEFSNRMLCAIRLKRRSSLEKPVPRWENVLTFAIGLGFIAFAMWDVWGLKIGTAPRQVATWESPTSSILDAGTRKRIDDGAGDLIRSGKLMGMVVGVVDGGKSCVLGYGRKGFHDGTPPEADTVFEIGSVTKTFTALCLGIMVQRGQVRLDDPLSTYLPETVHVPEYKGRKITLLDLAMHTSGLPTVPGSAWEWLGDNPYADYTTDKMYEFLSTYKLTRAPGAQYGYSNMGMGLVGLAMSRKYGTSYEEMVRSLVWKPLGMTDTAIRLSKDQQSRFADGCMMESNLGRLQFFVPATPWTMHDCFAGAGAIRSTANDMIKYLKANMGLTPNPQGLPFDMIQKKRKDVGGPLWIGLGWHGFKENKDTDLVWHNGGTGGYTSLVIFSKKHKKGLVILSNSADGPGRIDTFGHKLLSSMLKAK